ncbi:MAG: hypothetical protein JSV84_06230 [Gemmatimonadota bacterium]|nr:MAG: hypothetical protein JSV84_06230 [Gemmatimonadota bacterium]
MKAKGIILGVLLVFLIPYLLGGQERSSGQTFLSRSSTDDLGYGLSRGLSLLNPDRFSMSHSYTMSLFSSGGEGHMVGLYMNTMKYQFSNPLLLTVHVGYMHQPFATAHARRMTDANAVLSGFELEYRPTKNFFLKVEYGTTPALYNSYNRNGFWYGW